MAKLFAISGDPDQTPRFAASDLGSGGRGGGSGLTAYIWHSTDVRAE